MKAHYIKLLMVLALMVGGAFAFWNVASASSPTPPGGGALPDGHDYYKVFEAKYLVHDTRLESCLVCHSTDSGTGLVDGMNSYGDDLLTELQYDPDASEDGAGSGTCSDTLDNGADTVADKADPDCLNSTPAYRDGVEEDGAGPGSCSDGVDNGPDGLTDADDPDCDTSIEVNTTDHGDAHTIIWDALGAIEANDPDSSGCSGWSPVGDCQPSGYEIKALSFPGDGDDFFEHVPAAPIAGPHGGYLSEEGGGATLSYAPFQCATCHRAHTADAPMLLTSEPWGASGLCDTCHSGTGALTNVSDGEISSGVDAGSSIHGGGFVNAVMDTNVDDVDDTGDPPSAVSSTHTVDGTAGLMWGSTAAAQDGTGAGKIGVTLDCGNCHDPHGAAIGYGENPLDNDISNVLDFADALADSRVTLNYRMLQPNPRESGDYEETQPVFYPGRVPFMLAIPDDPSGIGYTQSYSAEDVEGTSGQVYRPVTDYQPNDRLVSWCSLCHTRYARVTVAQYEDGHSSHGAITERLDEGPGVPVDNDPIFSYAHATSEATCSTTSGCHGGYAEFSRPRCLDCHVSHGTSSGQTGVPDCQSCHGASVEEIVWDGNPPTLPSAGGAHDACYDCHGPGGPPQNVPFPGPKHVEWPGYDGKISPPIGTDAGSGQNGEWQNRTSLLRLDNRGVCTACHQK